MSSALRAMCLTSLLLHLLGLTALSVVGGSLWSAAPPSNVIPTELLVEPPPPVVPEPVPPPEPEPLPAQTAAQPEPEPLPPPPVPLPEPVTPPRLEKVIPPKLEKTIPPKFVQKPMPERVAPRVKTPPPVPPARRQEPAPSGPPLPAEARAAAPGNVLGAPAERPPEVAPPPPAEGGEAGAGKLFDRGDLGVVPGAGAGGGGGGTGRAGLGLGGVGASGGMLMAGLQPGAGGVGPGAGSGLARPLGGYQVKPRYPESARRQGIAGTTLLKIHVSDRGMVEDVLVERSAGNPDLDLAAMEAVKQWRFEPAKQGNRPVAVWVILPVRFALR